MVDSSYNDSNLASRRSTRTCSHLGPMIVLWKWTLIFIILSIDNQVSRHVPYSGCSLLVASYKLWSYHTIAICILSATFPSASTQRNSRLILWIGTMAVCYGAWISLYIGETQGHLFEFCCFPCRNLLKRIENFQKNIRWNTTSYGFHHYLSILLRDRSQSSISMTYPHGQ